MHLCFNLQIQDQNVSKFLLVCNFFLLGLPLELVLPPGKLNLKKCDLSMVKALFLLQLMILKQLLPAFVTA